MYNENFNSYENILNIANIYFFSNIEKLFKICLKYYMFSSIFSNLKK